MNCEKCGCVQTEVGVALDEQRTSTIRVKIVVYRCSFCKHERTATMTIVTQPTDDIGIKILAAEPEFRPAGIVVGVPDGLDG